MVAPAATSSIAPSTPASSAQNVEAIRRDGGQDAGDEGGERDISPSTTWVAGAGDDNMGAGLGCEDDLELSAEPTETEIDRAQHARRLEEAQVCCAARGYAC